MSKPHNLLPMRVFAMQRHGHLKLLHHCHYLVKHSLLLLLLLCTSNTVESRKGCSLPDEWHGEWFHSGVGEPAIIRENSISFKGTCVQSDQEKYLFRDRTLDCNRCLVIHMQHVNVLEYKETYCDRTRSLDRVCAQLTGDALLHSMFRLNAKPVACPFIDSYYFSYDQGYGVCRYPKGSIDLCTEDSKMLFRYQACADVYGSESKTVEIECVAKWKEGSNRYMVGKVDHALVSSDEDRYRCFVYAEWSYGNKSGYNIAQSGDASCNGLFSIHDGSKSMNLTKVPEHDSCAFPSWLEGPHWHSLNGHSTLHVTKRSSTLRITGHQSGALALLGHESMGPATLKCLSLHAKSETSQTYVTKVVNGCTTGYQCVHIKSRDEHVFELVMGSVTPYNHACSHHYFNKSSDNYYTFVSNSAESRTCPKSGKYQVTSTDVIGAGMGPQDIVEYAAMVGINQDGCQDASYTKLTVGCSSQDTLEIHTTCAHSVYSCHGWWEEGGKQYLVVTPTSRSSKSVKRLCFVLGGDSGGELKLGSSTQVCSRELVPGLHGFIAFNSTKVGKCEDNMFYNSGQSILNTKLDFIILSTLIAALLIIRSAYSHLQR